MLTFLYCFLCVVGEDDTQLAAVEVVEIACWLFYDFPGLLLLDLGPDTVASLIISPMRFLCKFYSESISK